MKLTAEEEIMRDLIQIYFKSAPSFRMDFATLRYDATKLLKVVERCKNAGMIRQILLDSCVKNVPKELIDAVVALHKDYVPRMKLARQKVAMIARALNKRSIDFIISGSYVVMKDILADGDIFVDEITIYLDRNANVSFDEERNALIFKDKSTLSLPDDKIKINLELESTSFFDEYHTQCLLVNEAPLDILYPEYREAAEESSEMNDKIVLFYILHREYLERSRLIIHNKINYAVPLLENIFSIKTMRL